MKKRTFFAWLFSLIFCLSFTGIARAADEAIAEVLTVVSGASLTRGGQTLPLERFAAVRVSDTISTDASGRARLLFKDDSTVDIGAGTSLDMRDFADSGSNPVFSLHLLQGVARAVTGKIVEANPKGFTVTTPEGTIGIRGTILSVRTVDGMTTVYVENTTRAVYVNNVNVPGGNKITVPGDPPRPSPILPQDRRDLGRDLAFRGGAGVAAAAPEPVGDGGRPEERLRGETARLVAQSGLIPPGSPLADSFLPVQNLGDALIARTLDFSPLAGGGGANTAKYAFDAGAATYGAFTNLRLGFTVSLTPGSGAITNGYMSGTGASLGSFSLTGGTGTVDTPIFYIDGFTGGPPAFRAYSYMIGAPFTPGAAAAVISSVLLSPDGVQTDAFNGSLSVPRVP
ncbi:MAG: FecR family protein [Desulfovibrio sp.]|jgi:hypothetical protein|nr:FecR family protein [Desulfovibrio sp.]